MCDNTLLCCWHIVLAPSSPKSVWWMLHSIFYWCSTPYQPKNGIKMLARFILQHFRIIACAMSSHCHLLALCQYFQHCFSFSFPRIYYDTAIGKDKMGKMYCRSYSTQISLKKKRQKWIHKVLPMVLPTQAFLPNYDFWVLLHFFSLLFRDTHTFFPHFILFWG